MNPLTTVYGGVVSVRNALYGRGLLRSRRLAGPVVSVGNLSTGGSGKTPFVILLGELLKARGIKFDVLSRGYGRTSRGALEVDPDGSPADFGDEPILIARRLQVSVFVGEDRFAAGRLAEANFGPELHLLDDGFQHRGLARDFDIVLLTPEDAEDRLLPGGRMREPVLSLRRADAVVLAAGVAPEKFPLQGKLLWRISRGILPQHVPPRPLVFCGIARPHNFVQQLRAVHIEPAAEALYRDHHAYTEKDVRELLQLKEQSEAGGFLTTEKDAINLGNHIYGLAPLSVVPVKMELQGAANALDTMLQVIAERRK